MTCNHTLQSRESLQPYMGYGGYWAFLLWQATKPSAARLRAGDFWLSPSAYSCISIGQNAHVKYEGFR